jgi:hypothetical protein
VPESLILDPTSEDASNVELDLVDGTNTFLLEAAYPPPDRDSMWAGSADTEGDPLIQHRYRNRVITLRLRVVGSTATALQTTLGQLQQKIGKINREGGTLKRTAPSGSTIVFDLVGASIDIPIDKRHLNLNRAEPVLTFEAKPFGRGAASAFSSHSETTLPVLVFTETGVAGDVPALGQLEVTEGSGADQVWLTWGIQSRHYDSATTAKLFYEAEDLTPLGTAAANAGPSGASGSTATKTILDGSLTTSYRAILSTQANGGSHMTHVGDYRVWARVQTPTGNTGAVSVAFEWATGDFRTFTQNPGVDLYPDSVSLGGWEGTWRLVDLGTVSLSPPTLGAQRWEGRLLAKSTVAGDDIYADCLAFVPITEGSGTVTGVNRFQTPTSFSARDEFDQTAGALNGKAMPVGGNWATSGAATDFAVESGDHVLERSTTSDGSARLAIAGTSSLAASVVQADLTRSGLDSSTVTGLIARYTDASNYLYVTVSINPTAITLYKIVGAAQSLLASTSLDFTPAADTAYTARLMVEASGRATVWFFAADGPTGTPWIETIDSDLATGGGLASGKAGLYDTNTGGSATTRSYDNFMLFTPAAADAAVFASQSGQIRHDGVLREDSTGTIWSAPSKYEGDYLLVPPAGREARTARFILKASRNDPATMPDTAIDDISAILTVTPRFLVVPE